ncbi:MAG: undecaprenyl-diphosphate phosphatase [Solobacterium sp.]|nr:undecaprenyl-diphosphate phosphatase [Solobacterium sp.]
MTVLLNLLKSVVFGIVQGITEWLPISSTGHLILMESFMPLNVFTDHAANEAFWSMYKVVIQFGSILAVMIMFWKKLNPFQPGLKPQKKRSILRLWLMILIASVPAGIVGLLLDDLIDTKLSSSYVIAATLIIYGILFIWMENQQREYTVQTTGQITVKNAFLAGAFQMLALIPGTSRSGATIFGETLLGFSRTAAAEFSFFMAIPVMFGASLLRIIKKLPGLPLNFSAVLVLLAGIIVSFVVSVFAIRRLLSYIRSHDFKIFGVYRILLGIVVLIFTVMKVIA